MASEGAAEVLPKVLATFYPHRPRKSSLLKGLTIGGKFVDQAFHSQLYTK